MWLKCAVHACFALLVPLCCDFREVWSDFTNAQTAVASEVTLPVRAVFAAQFVYHYLSMALMNKHVFRAQFAALVAYLAATQPALAPCALPLLALRPAESTPLLMGVHHVVSVALVVFAYRFRFVNHGLLVMFIMDASDVFMFAVRIENRRRPRRAAILAASALCALGSWFYLRMVKLGEIIYHSAAHVHELEDQHAAAWFLLACLCALWAMSSVWWLQLLAKTCAVFAR